MKKHSRRYAKNLEACSAMQRYPLNRALSVLMELSGAKFDESVELALHLGVDPKQGDQMVRGVVRLPNGNGKRIRVAVFTENEEAALAAGADHAGLKELIEKVREGWYDFDIAIATPAAMVELRPVAKLLGPRGLMPSLKAGTVTDNVATTIGEVKAGRCEFRMDKTANIALAIGKRSFGVEKLRENVIAAIEEIRRSCPVAVREHFIRSATLCTTMGPGIPLEWGEI
jgi:large subunit ribosomal protein L1